MGLAGATSGQSLPTGFTTAAAIRSVPEEKFVEREVHLRGTVLLPPRPKGKNFVLSDSTAAIYVEGVSGQCAAIELGSVVELVGRAVRGKFAPLVVASEIRIEGKGTIPPPEEVGFDDLLTGRYDAQWVSVAGTVRRIEVSEDPGGTARAEIASGGGRLNIECTTNEAPPVAVDAEVRVTGIVFYQFSRSGQMIRPLLTVPDSRAMQVVVPPPAEIPLKRIDRLLAFSADGAFGHRVRVRGLVTHHLPGEALWLEQDGRAVRVNLEETATYLPGEAVEIAGFVRLGGYSPELEDVTVKRLAFTGPEPACKLSSAIEASDHDAGLVSLRARLVEKMRVPQGMRLIFRDGDRDFPAVLRDPEGKYPLTGLQAGSQMQVTGICRVSALPMTSNPGTQEPAEFELIVRSPQDLVVVNPAPWWTEERRAWALAVLAAVAGLVALGFVWRARRKLRQSAAARRQSEAEFAAILGERNRIAREIHDTLAQGLGAISMHLEGVKGHLPSGSQPAAHLADASQVTRACLREARHSIWNMRSQVLEQHDLAEAVAGLLDRLTEGREVHGSFDATGDRFRMSPVMENNLLRIAQEAIANAVRHANATWIDVLLEYKPNRFTLRVRDDGRGFVPENQQESNSHFGLVGLRERAAEIGATLRLESSPGRGTDVTLDLPLPDAASSARRPSAA